MILLCILGITRMVVAQNFEQEFDALLETKLSHESPGGTALVVKEGKILYKKAFGVADLESQESMNSGNMFRIGSITKQFTACAIMRLAEQGKLSVQDSITKFIKDYPAHGQKITIEHLLTHTSGIKNITGMSSWTSEVQRKDFTPKEVVDLSCIPHASERLWLRGFKHWSKVGGSRSTSNCLLIKCPILFHLFYLLVDNSQSLLDVSPHPSNLPHELLTKKEHLFTKVNP